MIAHYHVISHTHWDREWYLPFEQFRVRLIDLIDNLLRILEQEPGYRFHLDAQTIMIEDYLEVKPRKKALLKRHVREGRILTGPWYVQNDFTLTSGEATIRNLLIGTEMAEHFGKCTLIGYVPDQFGLIAQLPQIFNGFGIDTVLFGRGYSFDTPVKAEFWWRGEDGSETLAVVMPYWYNNAQRFPDDPEQALRLLENIRRNLQKTSTTRHFLLMNGVDHLEAQEDLFPILNRLNVHISDDERIFQSTMPDYMEHVKHAVKDLAEHRGELRFGDEHQILAGTLSSRYYLKQWNSRIQAFLEHRLEPIFSFLVMLGIPEYPREMLRYLWKLLLQNHPHDDICGCSVDAVHQHMVDRFQRVREAGELLLQKGLNLFGEHFDRRHLFEYQHIILILNTCQNTRDGIVEVCVEFLKDANIRNLCLHDDSGQPVPFVIRNTFEKMKGIASPINLPTNIGVTAFDIAFLAKAVPGLGYAALIVTPESTSDTLAMNDARKIAGDSDPRTLENGFLRVEIHENGSLDMIDKRSGYRYRNLLLIEDREDVGDAYIYRQNPALTPILSDTVSASVKVLEHNTLRTIVEISYVLLLPESYCFERNARRPHLVEVPITVVLSLGKHAPSLEVSITIRNHVKDHRMRVLFPTGFSIETTYAGSPFDITKRDRNLLKSGLLKVRQQPNTGWIAVENRDVGLAILNEGLYEYEHLERTLALTLFRGNGFISNDQSALPVEETWLVPENQCLGEATFRLALYPFQGSVREANIAHRAQEFLNPLFCSTQPVDVKLFSGGRPFVQDSDIATIFFRSKRYPALDIPLRGQFITLRSDDLLLSCLKLGERRDYVILRIWNTSEEIGTGRLTTHRRVKKAYRLNLKEQRDKALPIAKNNSIEIHAKPKEIVTLELVFV